MLAKTKTALVCGAGGFIGSHLVDRLKNLGYWVRGADLKYPRFDETLADDFIKGDLRDITVVQRVLDQKFDEIYQLAADMGGAGWVFTKENDADIMHNSALINLNILDECNNRNIKKIFYSSSACIYPEYKQETIDNSGLKESDAYPAMPDSEYGWEKLFSEHLYNAYARNKNMDIRVARFHNIFGENGSWNDGREKAPAALCRKIAIAKLEHNGVIEVWGDGKQTRSFLYIDECINGIMKLMESNVTIPLNIGSEEQVSINQLVALISDIAKYRVDICYDLTKPQGVRGRNSENTLIQAKLNWKPSTKLYDGLVTTYNWIEQKVKEEKWFPDTNVQTHFTTSASIADAHMRDHLPSTKTEA